jgi:hypothetical protein
MTKITKLEEKTFEGKHSGYSVSFDDNRSGNLQEKQSDKGLRVGDIVIVTEIPYTSKAGKVSTLYGVRLSQATQSAPQPPTQQQQPQSKPGVLSTPANNVKANATIKAMEFCVNAFIADKITWDKIKEYHKEITGYLNDAIDECSS